jgi:hypothetical protein
MLTYDERLALRNAATLRSAQSAYDNLAEPEPEEGDDLLEHIRIAEEILGRAERAIRAGQVSAGIDLMTVAAGELTGAC